MTTSYAQENQKPFFSIIIPTYNSESFIEETLRSVFVQTYNNYEAIISDDGSTDNTVEVVRKFVRGYPNKKVVILLNKHDCPSAARNKGIEAANAEWISFLDSDDKWVERKLEKVAAFIEDNSGINLICHNEIWKKDSGDVLFDYAKKHDLSVHPFLSLYRQNTLSPSTVTVKKDILIDAGMFDESVYSVEDYDLWLRLSILPNIRIGFIDEALGYYFSREGNITSNIELRVEYLLKVQKKYDEYLRKISRFPVIERLKYKGKHYVWAGLQLIRKSDYKRGIYYYVKGLMIWPVRIDLIKKLLSKLRGLCKQGIE